MTDEINHEGHVLVIGAAGTDIVGRPAQAVLMRTSNPARLRMSQGGVARNVAENLARLGSEVILISAVGDDDQGRGLLQHAAEAGVSVEHTLVVEGARSGVYLAVLDEAGNLMLALDDLRVIEAITPEVLRERKQLFEGAAAVFVDANLAPNTLSAAVGLARGAGAHVVADPTSASLAPRLERHLADLWLVTPNEAEAGALTPVSVTHANRDQALEAARHLISRGVDIAVVTMAEFGVCYASAEGSGHIPAVQTEILDPTGAGDALTAAVIFALLSDIPLDEAIRLGASAAALTLRSTETVRRDLSLELLYDELV